MKRFDILLKELQDTQEREKFLAKALYDTCVITLRTQPRKISMAEWKAVAAAMDEAKKILAP